MKYFKRIIFILILILTLASCKKESDSEIKYTLYENVELGECDEFDISYKIPSHQYVHITFTKNTPWIIYKFSVYEYLYRDNGSKYKRRTSALVDTNIFSIDFKDNQKKLNNLDTYIENGDYYVDIYNNKKSELELGCDMVNSKNHTDDYYCYDFNTNNSYLNCLNSGEVLDYKLDYPATIVEIRTSLDNYGEKYKVNFTGDENVAMKILDSYGNEVENDITRNKDNNNYVYYACIYKTSNIIEEANFSISVDYAEIYDGYGFEIPNGSTSAQYNYNRFIFYCTESCKYNFTLTNSDITIAIYKNDTNTIAYMTSLKDILLEKGEKYYIELRNENLFESQTGVLNITKPITQNETKKLEVGETKSKEYNYKNTSQEYVFECQKTQKYNIIVTQEQIINVYDSLDNEIIKSNDGYFLEDNKKYNIVVSNFSDLDIEYSITIDYPDVGNEIEVPSYSVYYLRYIPSESNVYYIDGINTYYNGTAKDIAFLNKDERYEIEVTNYSSSNLVITPNILIPRESGTKYIYEDIQLSGDYIINSDNQCYVVINNKIRDIITGEIIYLNATKVYSKSEIAVESANCSYIPYLNGEEIISKGINRIMLADDIVITVRRYQDGEYVSDYNGFVIQQELPDVMDASVYKIRLTNIPNRPNFEFALAPLNPTIAEITFDKVIDEKDINISIDIRFEENFNGVIKVTVGEKKYEFNVFNGYLDAVIHLNHKSIQFDKYNELIMFLYGSYNNNNEYDIIMYYYHLFEDECMISIDSNILIDYLLSPDFSYDYMDYLHNTVSASNNYNTVINKNKSYILSTINKEWVNGLYFNDIRHELQLLSILENYLLDDGINHDSYFSGDAIIENIRLRKSLYYKADYTFSIHSSYLYAVFKGSGYEIHNLHIEQNNLFVANYGEITNVRFVECSFRVVFSTYGYGIEEDVDFIYS